MPAEPTPPFSVTLCNTLVAVASRLVPQAQRADWKREWSAELWHRWQFFYHAGLWSKREAYRLVLSCLGAFPDAAWHFAGQETVQHRVREYARSPWTCVAILALAIAILASFTSGVPATRRLLQADSAKSDRLLFIWLHPVIGGTDRGMPQDVAPAWASHSKLLEGAASFSISRNVFPVSGTKNSRRAMVIDSTPSLFEVLNVKPALGHLPVQSGIVLDHRTWVSLFRRNPSIVGSKVEIGGKLEQVAAVLPASFEFLSRHPAVYRVQAVMPERRVMVLARSRPGVAANQLDKELTKIAQDVCYYFYNGQIRMIFLTDALLTPLRFFGISVLVAVLMAIALCRVRLSQLRAAWAPAARAATLRRASFFGAKAVLSLALVFMAGLEWSRSETSILFGSRDPGSGPFLIWLYILGAMGVMFWSLADQRARCRVCLRLLCFPVRIGCPGCLLLDWSGTELLCDEGCGVLHVPHMAPSWDDESEHWIPLDSSWKDLFVSMR